MVCNSCNPCIHFPFTVFQGPLYQFPHIAFQRMPCFCFHVHIIWSQTSSPSYTSTLYTVLTTSPNASALYRVLQAPGLGKNEVFKKEKNKSISDGFQMQSQSSSATDRGSRIHSLTQKLTFKMKSADELLIAGCCSWKVYSCLTWSVLLTSRHVEGSLLKRMNLIMWPAV